MAICKTERVMRLAVSAGISHVDRELLERFASLVANDCARLAAHQNRTKYNKACPRAVPGWWPDQVLFRCAAAIRSNYGALATPPGDG